MCHSKRNPKRYKFRDVRFYRAWVLVSGSTLDSGVAVLDRIASPYVGIGGERLGCRMPLPPLEGPSPISRCISLLPCPSSLLSSSEPPDVYSGGACCGFMWARLISVGERTGPGDVGWDVVR